MVRYFNHNSNWFFSSSAAATSLPMKKMYENTFSRSSFAHLTLHLFHTHRLFSIHSVQNLYIYQNFQFKFSEIIAEKIIFFSKSLLIRGDSPGALFIYIQSMYQNISFFIAFKRNIFFLIAKVHWLTI